MSSAFVPVAGPRPGVSDPPLGGRTGNTHENKSEIRFFRAYDASALPWVPLDTPFQAF